MGRFLRFIAYLVLLVFGFVALVLYALVRLPMEALHGPDRARRQEPQSPPYMRRWTPTRRWDAQRDLDQWDARFESLQQKDKV